MKLVGCSNCFKAVPNKLTRIVDGKRVCHECSKSKKA